MKFTLRVLGVLVGLAFIVFALYLFGVSGASTQQAGLLAKLSVFAMGAYFVFYGVTGYSSIYSFFRNKNGHE